MPTFQTLWSRLIGEVPILDPLKARRFVNYAYADIREARRWSFLSSTTFLDIPAAISTGSFSVTQFSSTAIPSPAAKAILDALTLSIPITKRQFRVADGSLYQITAYDSSGAGTLTFTPSYRGSTNPTASYKIYRAYYDAPSDFLRWTSLVDIDNNRSICPFHTREDLHGLDPRRTSYNFPSLLASFSADFNYGGSGTGAPLFELYPHPTTAATVDCRYEKAGTDFSTDQDNLPAAISESTILSGALAHAYRWSAANSARFSELRGVPWITLMEGARRQFLDSLRADVINDEEAFPISLHSSPHPCRYLHRLVDDSQWAFTHAVSSPGGY